MAALEKAMAEGGSVGVKAAEVVAAYAVGRPPQTLQLEGPDGGPVRVSFNIRPKAS